MLKASAFAAVLILGTGMFIALAAAALIQPASALLGAMLLFFGLVLVMGARPPET